jgi:hypothetical protein
LSSLKLLYDIPKLLIADPLFSGKPGEPCILENPHLYIISYIVVKNGHFSLFCGNGKGKIPLLAAIWAYPMPSA